jgi:hypothetical protein
MSGAGVVLVPGCSPYAAYLFASTKSKVDVVAPPILMALPSFDDTIESWRAPSLKLDSEELYAEAVLLGVAPSDFSCCEKATVELCIAANESYELPPSAAD